MLKNVMGESFQKNLMKLTYNRTIDEHKHCELKDVRLMKTWSFYEAKVGHRELQDFLKIFRSPEPYFPIGNLKDSKIHSFFGRVFFGYILCLILLSGCCALFLIPFRCFPKAWTDVLSNPYSGFSKVNDMDDVNAKKKLTTIKKVFTSVPLVDTVGKVKHVCSILLLICFSISTYMIFRSNFGRESQCGLVNQIHEYFDDKNESFFKYFGMKKNNFLMNFNQDLHEYKPG
jgi:hypothetical protein